MLRWPWYFVFFCLAGTAVARDAESGKAAPPLDAKTLDGQHFTLAGHAGKVVIVNIWATWCGPCREEMPALEDFYRKHHGEGLELLAISADDAGDLPQVREVMKAFSFPSALLRDTRMSGYGRIRQIPQTYVIDARGILRRDGFVDKGMIDRELLERVVTPLLQQSTPSAR